MPPILTITGPGQIASGWKFLWLKYVTGFRPAVHCARCLEGSYSTYLGLQVPHGQPIMLNERSSWDTLYLCGVAKRGGWAANLHLAAVYEEGAEAEVTASTGSRFVIRNARALPIPALPQGFAGKSMSFTTCRNWQFGVSRFGLALPATP